MRSRLPEHAVVALLRQCFITPRCQASRWAATSRPRSSTTAPSSYMEFRHSLPKPTSVNRQQRGVQPKREDLENGFWRAELPSYSKLSPTDVQGFRQPVTLVGAPNKDGEQQHKEQERIAVLGGGITGLTSAHYLARELPNAKITVYEGSGRLGGWLRSKQVDVGNGTVLFEGGPRTLRPSTPAAMVTLEMISQLGLQEELLITSNYSVAAQNRFVYYPDHLVRMPGPGQDLYSMAWGLLTEPVFKGLFSGAIFEYNRPSRPINLDDESVGSFLERRLGSPDPGNNIVSAVLHGIYAGDICQLSAKSLMPKFWYYEGFRGSISNSMYSAMRERSHWIPLRDAALQNEMIQKVDKNVLNLMGGASVYTFKEGIGALSESLERSLRANPNVEFKMNEEVSRIEYDGENDGVKITNSENLPPAKYSKAISTISGRTLSTVTAGALPSLAAMHAVTIMVVNLYYTNRDLLPERGFGYLIPRSISFDQNPECALGVVFDSDSSTGQDTASGTKVTVMLGGHWWDGFASYPDEEEGAAMAKAVLRRHLRVEEEPEAVNVGLRRECIPQYTVGHESRMKAAHNELFSEFRGKLTVAGNSYTGVGLNDCVRVARDVVMDLKDGQRKTGLEEFVRPREWAQTRLPSRAEMEISMQRRGFGEKPPGR